MDVGILQDARGARDRNRSSGYVRLSHVRLDVQLVLALRRISTDRI
jgi:hypothetical protein